MIEYMQNGDSNKIKKQYISNSLEDNLLFRLSRQNFEEGDIKAVVELCKKQTVDWPSVLRIVTTHGVAPLVYANLRKCGLQTLDIPPQIVGEFNAIFMRNMLVKEKTASNLLKAVKLFQSQSIDVMVIKGGALDLVVYDQLYYTTMLDVDLVIKRKRSDVSEEQFEEFMHIFHGRGLEYDYFEHHDVTMNGTLPIDFEQIWDDATEIDFRGHKIYVMSPEDTVITLCINSCRKRFFRLKSLCDIAETIKKFSTLNWECFAEKAKIYDCQFIVYTALFVTQMTVGCSLPPNLLQKLKIHPFRKKLIHLMCRRMSTQSFSSLYANNTLLNRHLDYSLALSYLNFKYYQIWRRLKYLVLFEEGERRREFQWPHKFFLSH